jgi:hypothetical protein
MNSSPETVIVSGDKSTLIMRPVSGEYYMMHMMWKDTQERLFFRDITYFNSRIGGQKVFWARGNGWVAAKMPRVLRYASDAALKAVWSDGAENGSAAQIGLGNHGDRFMTFDYSDALSPDAGWTERQFVLPRDWTVEGFTSLSVLIRGQADNAPGQFYVRLEDADGGVSVQRVPDAGVVRQGIWQHVNFDFSTFQGVDLTCVSKIRLGVASATGEGALRIDTIRLNPVTCDMLQGDFDGDCRIDVNDLALLAAHWLECGLYPAESCGD